MSSAPYPSTSLELAPQSLVLTRNDDSPHHSILTLTNNTMRPVLYNIRKPDEASQFIDVSPSCGIISSTAWDQVVHFNSLQNTSLDLTLGHSLVIENWHLDQDIHTDAISMLPEINSRADDAPEAMFLEFHIIYVETGPAAVGNHAPVVSPTEYHEESVLIASNRYTHSPSGASASSYLLADPTISSYGATIGPAGSRNHIISVKDITMEGPNPVDVTGNFSDIFVGMYRNTVRVALKRLRIDRHPSQHDRRELELLETADAVAYLHSKGIVHGDIKARNILVSESRHALLCDFGLAKWADS
ncbi:hypothetical protein FS837_011503, partial [Tulasnella sp. UAMH 9824]